MVVNKYLYNILMISLFVDFFFHLNRCDNGSDTLTVWGEVSSSPSPNARGSGSQWKLLERLCSKRTTLPPRLMGGPGARLRLELTSAVLPHYLRENTVTQNAPSGGVTGGGGGKKSLQRGIGGSGLGATRRHNGFRAQYRFVNGLFTLNVINC